MPLEACPTCGYAVSMTDHQCRHCPGPSAPVFKFTTLDRTNVTRAILIVIAGVVIYWQFIAH